MTGNSSIDRTFALDIELDSGSGVPLYRQIADRIWMAVVEDLIEVGTRLPTVRRLAIDLGVHPDTVQRAYRELELLGVIRTEPGAGSVVGLGPSRRAELERRRTLEKICADAVARADAVGGSVDDLVELLTEFRRTAPKRTRSP